MAVSTIFQTLRSRVEKSKGLLPAEKRAMYWFTNYTKELKNWQRKQSGLFFNKLTQDPSFQKSVHPTAAEPGLIYFFLYDPKLSPTLPYYDQFPMVLVLDVYSDSFLGVNFHYLDYYYRAMFFDALYPLRESTAVLNKAQGLRIRLQVSYDLLRMTSKYKMFRPCLKKYLFSQVQSPLLQVGMQDWDLALFMPVESFMKESKQAVWSESEQMF
jgi:hypothetical protein